MEKESGNDLFKEVIKRKMAILMVIDLRSKQKLQTLMNKKLKKCKNKIVKILFNKEEIKIREWNKKKILLLKVNSVEKILLNQFKEPLWSKSHKI